MNTRLLLALAGNFGFFAGFFLTPVAAAAQEPVAAPSARPAPPVMVEMFTSQGCPNCPKADAFLARLAQRQNVIAISFAVDYWDYLGWRDTFASPAFTARQYAYGQALHKPRVYTPQMVLNGRKIYKGTLENKIIDGIEAARREAPPKAPQLRARLNEKGDLVLDIEGQSGASAVIWLAAYTPGVQSIKIGGGENKGKTMAQVNMVHHLTRVARWDGSKVHMIMPMPEDGGCAIFLQDEHHGPILAAVKVEA